MPRLLLVCALVVLATCQSSNAPGAIDTGGAPRDTASHPTPDGHDWPAFGVDEGRSSVFTAPTGVAAADLAGMQLQRVTLDGTVDASPIYLHDVTVGGARRDVFLVTTTYGKTLAIDASTGAILWRFTPPGYAGWAGSYRITNATPVADPGREFVYAASPDGYVRKLAVADGHAAWSTAITLLPTREKIASSLNFSRGHVIATTGGYVGDAPPYQGHVAVLDAGTGRLLSVWNSLCSDRAGLIDPASCGESGSAIWGRAGAVVDGATGNLLVATGNGRWDGRTSWGDAVIELDPDATRVLANWTPSNTAQLEQGDVDLGSTSPVLLDGTHVAQGGKDGSFAVLDLARLAGAAPHLGGELQSVSTPGGNALFSAPAVWRRSDGTWLFAADGGGTAAYRYEGGALTTVWRAAHSGTSPVVAGGLLFVYDPGGALRVYQPETGQEVATLDCGGGHWNSPIVADGRIALPEGSANDHATSGVLDIWRVPRS